MKSASISILALAALMPAFANGPVFAAAKEGAGGGAPAPTPTPTPSPTPTPIAEAPKASGEQPGVKTAPARTDVPPPVKRQGTRGGQTLYDFEGLELGASIGVFDKAAKAVSSTVASANKRYMLEVKDAAGNVIMIDNPKKPGTKMVLKQASKKFVSAATDPATDPDKAPVRIWRVAP